jgi:hypothetical protein
MALGYLIDENPCGPLWAAVRRAKARRAFSLGIACVGERNAREGVVSLFRWATPA